MMVVVVAVVRADEDCSNANTGSEGGGDDSSFSGEEEK